MTDVPALPAEWRPRTTRLVAYATAGAIMLAMIVLAVFLAPQFSIVDRVLIILVGVALSWVLHMLARCRITADESGLTIVNAFRTRRLEWAQVVDLTMTVGDPWPRLDLSDGTALGAMGIQGAEKTRAARQVTELTTLLKARSETPDRG